MSFFCESRHDKVFFLCLILLYLEKEEKERQKERSKRRESKSQEKSCKDTFLVFQSFSSFSA